MVEKTEAEIIAQLEKLGFSLITDFASWDKNGFKLTAFGGTFLATLPIFAIITNSYTIKLKPSKEIPKDKIPALKSITIDEQEYTNKKGKKGITRRVKIDLHSPKGSLDSLAKIKGMMKPDLKDVVSFAQALHEAMKDEE